MNTIQDINIALRESAKAVEHIALVVQELSHQANDRLKNIDQLLAASHEIKRKVQLLDKINNNVKYIDNEITLLSLNTAIEAAHFNSSGDAFSLIAKQMRNLANKSRIGTTEMTDLFRDIEGKANAIDVAITAARENAALNNTAMQDVTSVIEEITATIEEISTRLEGLST